MESYTKAFKNFGFTDEEAHKKATGYIGALYLIQGAYGLKNAQILVKQFGKDVAKPSVTTPKGNNAGAGNNWTADKNGAFSPKDDGTVTNVGKGNSEFDGKTIYDANGSVYEGGVWKPKVTNGSQNAIDKEQLANPITQSRINIQNGNAKAGWEHLVKRHFLESLMLVNLQLVNRKLNHCFKILMSQRFRLVRYKYQIIKQLDRKRYCTKG
ncbi:MULTISPECIES: hypothetical protein [Providencia]|uniref:hypothetical protein n=1 Tax=Providencia TaxID=586 RepID=UPI0018C76718|nr:hypothetical protein [Providencia stuartii]MBG5918804.1 hypothetical protein [Providencia stuartii]